MAIVDKIRPETIERLRGVIDFYMLREILPVARSWPKKPKPPYTALQAEGMAVFSLVCKNMHRLEPSVLTAWQVSTEGKRSQWTDIYKGLAMKYWKTHRTVSPIALAYEVIEEVDQFKVSWKILQLYLDPEVPEEILELETALISKADILYAPKPIYFTLLSDDKERLIAPFIPFEVL